MKSSLILIDKPSGLSSSQVVGKVKHQLDLKRQNIPIGHAGTLDPFATGLLVCLLGRATKLSQFALGADKTYTGTIQFGISTDTDDTTGATLATGTPQFTSEALAKAVASLTGQISQTPPQISAIHVDGQRAYARVRAGETVTLTPRSVLVRQFDVGPTDEPTVYRYRVVCSSGTYVRALARDLGQMLGCGAAVHTLRREASGSLSVEQAVTLERLTAADALPWWRVVMELPRLNIAAELNVALAGGDQRGLQSIRPGGTLTPASLYLYCVKDVPQGLLRVSGQHMELLVHVGE